MRLFILPPTANSLRQRLIKRPDSSAVIAKRMAEASHEMSHWPEYHYVVINDDVEESHRMVTAILTAERLRRHRQLGLTEFVRGMTKKL